VVTYLMVSILISVDSGLILLLYLYNFFMISVSILISVDSGLIQVKITLFGKVIEMFQSLFQWIPVLYLAASIASVIAMAGEFQSLFQWIPVLY